MRKLTVLLSVALLVTAIATISAVATPAAAVAATCNDCDYDDSPIGGGGGGSPTGAVQIEFRVWGAIVSLDRATGCFAASGFATEGEGLMLAAIPPPFNLAAVLAVKLHKAWIGARMGTAGVDVHINWAGFVHWVEPRGSLQGC